MALKVCDWTKYVVPRENKTYTTQNKDKDKMLTTHDNVSVLSVEDTEKDKRLQLKEKSATDFAFMNCLMQYNTKRDNDGCYYAWYWIRSTDELGVYIRSFYRPIQSARSYNTNIGTSPSITLAFDKKLSLKDIEEVFGVPAKSKSKNSYTLELGSFPQTKVSEKLRKELEEAYNGGKLQNGMECTGRLYTTNGVINQCGFSPKQNSEFIYKGKRYVRTTELCDNYNEYQDGTISSMGSKNDNPAKMWVKVEPLTFEIANYDDLEKGTNELILDCEKIIMGGMPVFPGNDHEKEYPHIWAGSLLRAFLNSAQTKDLDLPEGFRPIKNFDFRNEGFLYQALNMTRPPVTKYKIPEYVDEVCDYSFEGCVGLKKILIPSQIKQIGKEAFSACVHAQLIFGRGNDELKLDRHALDGTNFKYIYVTNDNQNMIWVQDVDESLEKTCKRYKFDKKNFKKQVNAIFKLNFFYDREVHKLFENGGNYLDLE